MVRTVATFFYVHIGLDGYDVKDFADYSNINIVGNYIELYSRTCLA